MADLNEVRLIGRLTRDPELRSTPGGVDVATFGLATGRKYKQDGVTKEETTFVDVTCWGKLAEIVEQYTKKGRLLYIGGRLKFDTWQDNNTGQNRSKLSVVADNVQFLDKNEGYNQQQQAQQAHSNQSHASSYSGNSQQGNGYNPPNSVTVGLGGNGQQANVNNQGYRNGQQASGQQQSFLADGQPARQTPTGGSMYDWENGGDDEPPF